MRFKPEPIFTLRSFTRLIAAVALASCSSTPLSLDERYGRMGPIARQAFLAYYPILRSREDDDLSQRDLALLENGSPDSAEILRFRDKFPQYAENPPSYTLVGMEITGGRPDPIADGADLPLRAILKYGDGRRADATRDVHWSVRPPLARIEGTTLRFACVHSDVTVSADFLGERTGSRTFALRKPLSAIELSIDGGSQAIERTDFVKLRLHAVCRDGTRSEVTCQADWSSPSRGIEARGCGNIRLTPERRAPFTVTASYGSLSVSRSFHTPLRR